LARVSMGIIKDRHGTYYVQRRVPERLQEEVARVLNTGERRVSLKKSLGTKSLKEAKAAAPAQPRRLMAGIGLYGPAVTQDSLVTPSATRVAGFQTATSGLRRVIWRHTQRF
jgi:hypothetical protein